MAKKPLIAVTPSSGNVFADIGVAEPEEAIGESTTREPNSRNRSQQSPHAGRCRCRHGHRSAQGIGIAERPTHKLLERTPGASSDQARPRRRDRRQDETAPTPARSDPRRSRSPRLIAVRGEASSVQACSLVVLEAPCRRSPPGFSRWLEMSSRGTRLHAEGAARDESLEALRRSV
jgi:hypothetical protein